MRYNLDQTKIIDIQTTFRFEIGIEADAANMALGLTENITGYIQFRKDYVVTTPANLYDEVHDDILNKLKEVFKYKGPFGQYRMRCGYEFEYDNYKITYHKTLPYSKIKLKRNSLCLKKFLLLHSYTFS